MHIHFSCFQDLIPLFSSCLILSWHSSTSFLLFFKWLVPLSPIPPLLVLLCYRHFIHQGPPSPSVLFRIMLRQSFLPLCHPLQERETERERELEKGQCKRRGPEWERKHLNSVISTLLLHLILLTNQKRQKSADILTLTITITGSYKRFILE